MFATLNEPILTAAVLYARQLFLLVERCSSPVDNVWTRAPVISKRSLSEIGGQFVADASGRNNDNFWTPWASDCPVRQDQSQLEWLNCAPSRFNPLEVWCQITVLYGGSLAPFHNIQPHSVLLQKWKDNCNHLISKGLSNIPGFRIVLRTWNSRSVVCITCIGDAVYYC